jgi:3-hydroxyisobutyrate dehydrogenase
MTNIAFIGLGNMGAPMAANLVRAGHVVTGFDVVSRLCEEARRNGIAIAATAPAAAADAEVIITMLQSGPQVVGVWKNTVPAAPAKALFIDSSTVDVKSARDAHLLAQAAGARSIDAPVSGGTGGAQAATLTFMCGGEPEAFSAAEAILKAMGKKIIHCGPAGSGQAAKICNNMMLGINMIATAEAFVLAEKLGLSDQALFDVASTSSGQSWSLTSYCPVPGPVPSSPANRQYKPGFAAALMLKDLRLAQECAAATGTAARLGAAALQMYELYNAAGEGATDFSGIIQFIRGKTNERP